MADLKNGSTVNGTLIEIDRFMNLKFENAVITSKDGDTFHKAQEYYVRGNSIKYVRIPDSALVKATSLVKKKIKASKLKPSNLKT
jgi:U6 snRNA-associated Sm-like protein LSm4